MNERLAAADAALKSGRRDEAIDHIIAALTEDPAQSAQIYRVLLIQLYSAGRSAEAEPWSAKAAERFPKDSELLNIRGVLLRNVKRQADALPVLEQALKLAPNNVSIQVNRGNILMDLGEYARAEAVFTQLSRKDPRNAEHHRQIGRALARQHKPDQAIVRFRQAVNIKKDAVDAWQDLVGILSEQQRTEDALVAIDKAIETNPNEQKFLESKTIILRSSGQLRAAEAYLLSLLPELENEAWLQHQLGTVISDYDRDRGNVHMRRAVELDPTKLNHRLALVESLERTRTGDEGANIEESYRLMLGAEGPDETTSTYTKIANEIFIRVCDFDALDRLGTFKDLGREWASSGRHTALLKQLARVRTDEDRLELVEQHRIWGRLTEKRASTSPIRHPGPRAPDGRIRLGLMSSDLRQHPVGYFALPLFDHIDERFDVYVYSFYQGIEDALQKSITKQVKAYRWTPDVSSREAAQTIANDQLDILIELGGSTHMNKLDVMAYRPAPLQASWLGYPHSAGLDTIDYMVCDPYGVPPRPELMVEKPLMMPHTWLALGKAVFSDQHVVSGEIPEDRNGFITFGTANNPHKYSRDVLQTWARVVAATPNSKFAFVRPEGSSPSFRRNVLAQFASQGVDESRVIFHTVRGRHMPFYNELDITLDPFPLTGGTTTTESLWMGVPVINLRGEAFFERLSYSILSNAGLGDLSAETIDGYMANAARLAADKERRRQLRKSLRDDLRASPLGQTETFAKDFYDMIAGAVAKG